MTAFAIECARACNAVGANVRPADRQGGSTRWHSCDHTYAHQANARPGWSTCLDGLEWHKEGRYCAAGHGECVPFLPNEDEGEEDDIRGIFLEDRH